MLCKCSGKYIDIYFILKITFYPVFHPVVELHCSREHRMGNDDDVNDL